MDGVQDHRGTELQPVKGDAEEEDGARGGGSGN